MSALDERPYLDFPVGLSPSGLLRTTDADDHLRDLVLQVLLTEPGERVNRPDFGCGIRRLVFAPDGDVLRATTQFLVTQNLQRWLGDRIDVQDVEVTSAPDADGHGVRIEVAYVVVATQRRDVVVVTL